MISDFEVILKQLFIDFGKHFKENYRDLSEEKKKLFQDYYKILNCMRKLSQEIVKIGNGPSTDFLWAYSSILPMLRSKTGLQISEKDAMLSS